MFTGIIEETGVIKNIKRGEKSAVLTIFCQKVLEDVKIGDSIAVNGICLTAVSYDRQYFMADVMNETLSRTKGFDIGERVNLERALSVNDRFGGHIVSGHIDGTGVIESVKRDDNAVWYRIKTDSRILKYIIEKGSVAIDGTSLTVANVDKESFSVSVIPHTLSNTVLQYKKAGDFVNLENDVIGKYVEKLLAYDDSKNSSKLTKEFLLKNGF